MKQIALGFFVMLIAVSAYADDYKKNYCGNKTYVAVGDKYPHLHCDKSFFVYSEASNKHKDMAQGDTRYCENTRAAIDDVKARGPSKVVGYQEVLDSMLSFARVYCKK
ncbi:hypothetical protein [Chromobacterium sp. CV08]|uniref:hypothetical protein n=1 Tax=Chromobacterium sp. CV08 TaxID=3133274 RepID=UPI003DAA20F1